MAIPSRQIGWGTEDNLLWQISKQLQYLIQVTASSLNSFISQTITCGVTDMVPSEDAVCQALLLKQDISRDKCVDLEHLQTGLVNGLQWIRICV